MRFSATPGWGRLVLVVGGPSPMLAKGRGFRSPQLLVGGGLLVPMVAVAWVCVSCACAGVFVCVYCGVVVVLSVACPRFFELWLAGWSCVWRA